MGRKKTHVTIRLALLCSRICVGLAVEGIVWTSFCPRYCKNIAILGGALMCFLLFGPFWERLPQLTNIFGKA